MKKYTIGILFTEDLERVLLINKTHPEWQAGKMNFPGGHIEPSETNFECISREFREETNLAIPTWHWQHIGQIKNGNIYFVDIFAALYNEITHGQLIQLTDEKPEWCHVQHLPANVISNLYWLVPFAINIFKQGNADYLKFGNFDYYYK